MKVDIFSAGGTSVFIFSGGQEPFDPSMRYPRTKPDFQTAKAIEAKLPQDFPREAVVLLKVSKTLD